METPFESPYRGITVSGRIAVGSSTLARKLRDTLGWQYVNAGEIQRQYDREHNMKENEHGAAFRSDDHEREIDGMTKKMLSTETNIVYEAWLAGFMAQGLDRIFKVLLVCSSNAVRIDRVMNRDNVSIDEAKRFLKQREEENVVKWKELYGDYDFWDPKYFDLVIDTYASGATETLDIALDKIGYKNELKK